MANGSGKLYASSNYEYRVSDAPYSSAATAAALPVDNDFYEPQPEELTYAPPVRRPQVRRKSLLGFLAVRIVVLCAAAFFAGMLLLSRYELISELNGQISGITQQSDIYASELSSLKIDLACSVDLQAAASLASDEGMKYPHDDQLVRVDLTRPAPLPEHR